jgi:nucleotide-binding universal stress UspA family protein
MNTNPIQRILVPTDLSDFSDLALDYALYFQKRLESQITLMYAEEFTFVFTGEYPIGYYFEDVNAMKKHASKLLHEYVKTHVPSACPVATILVDDTPARAVVRTADDLNADLIIMGTHGRHGIHRAFLGSVTERVLRETQRPVMTVLPKEGTPRGQVKIETILCPVNFTTVAREAVENASVLAAALDAQLIVMNVVEGDIATPGEEKRFSAWIDLLLPSRTRYEQIIVKGDPASRVLETAEQLGADLILIGAQHKLFKDATVIGTTTERITRFARQPVLTVVRRTAVAKDQRPLELVVTGS